MTSSDTLRKGGCLCGLVRYEVRLPPRFVAHCHCGNCRRAHGAAFVTFAGFPSDAFRWLQGEQALTRFESDVRSRRSFCSRCGSTVLFEGERWPGEVHVAVAHLDEGHGLVPTAHAHADRAPEWCPITDELARYGGPNGNEPLSDDGEA